MKNIIAVKASINRIKPEGQWKIEFSLIEASGSIGSKTRYQIGVVTLILGIFLLIIINKNLIKNN